MQKYNESQGTLLVAPSPTVPRYRPSSQSSKRANYAAAVLPKYQQYLSMADDRLLTDKSNARTINGNATEILLLLQAHESSEGSSQSTGAREMIKAGQRRLRLALRNKKRLESKVRAGESSCPQEEYLSKAIPRISGHKRSMDSTASGSKSISSFSFKSNSRLDVETIGQPWLQDPLESGNSPRSKGSSQLSSLDLRDLASFVEAAVNFSSDLEDTNPPPYQPPTEWNYSYTIEQPSGTISTSTSASEHISQSDVFPATNTSAPSTSSTTEPGNNPRNELNRMHLPAPLQINPPARAKISNDGSSVSYNALCNAVHRVGDANVIQAENTAPEEGKSKELQGVASEVPKPNFPTASRRSPVPTAPLLKLFPDAMPPRVSSKGALHIPSCRSPTPSRSPTAPPSCRTNTTSEPNSQDSRSLTNNLPKIQEDSPDVRKGDPVTSQRKESSVNHVGNLVSENLGEEKDTRRHSSLLMGTIEAFPLPAPIRRLPSVPAITLPINPVGDQKLPIGQQSSQVELECPNPESPCKSSPNNDISAPIKPENGRISSHGRASPPPGLVMGPKSPANAHNTASELAAPDQSLCDTSTRVRNSRADRVRSLRMRDLAASRRYLNASNKTLDMERSFGVQKDSQKPVSSGGDGCRLNVRQRYQRKVSPSPSSPPPVAPPPSDPPRPLFQGRRHCTSPAGHMPGRSDSCEAILLSASNRSSRVCRRNSARSVETKHETASMGPNIVDSSETPLPSSDDERTAGYFHWDQRGLTSGRCRRADSTPFIVDEPISPRERPLKKHQSSAYIRPPTPLYYDRRSSKKARHIHHSPNDYRPYDTRGCFASESNPNLSLEGRVEQLERQNRILQAALLAALNIGVREDLPIMLGASAASLSTNPTPPLTGRSSLSENTSASEEHAVEQERHACEDKATYRPESWITSPDSFGRKGYDSDYSAGDRELEEMIEGFDLEWLSDRSSVNQRV